MIFFSHGEPVPSTRSVYACPDFEQSIIARCPGSLALLANLVTFS